MLDPTPASVSETRWLRLSGAVLGLIALTAILGYFGHWLALATMVPGGSPLMMNTSLCFLLCGLGLWSISAGWRRTARCCGAFVAVFAAALVAQYLLGRDLGLDKLFWHHPFVTNARYAPGRMAPSSAVALLLGGVSLLLMAAKRRSTWALSVLGGGIKALALLPLLTFLTSLSPAMNLGTYHGMSLPTIAGLTAIAGAALRRARRDADERTAAIPLFAAAIALLVSVGAVSVTSNTALIEANQWIVHTHEVRGAVGRLVVQAASMESAARGYALSGDEVFRARSEMHRTNILIQLDAVDRLVADNPTQVDRARRLGVLVEQAVALNEKILRARTERGGEAAAQIMIDQTSVVMNALSDWGDKMQAVEAQLLVERELEETTIERRTRAIQWLGSLLALGLLGAAAVWARRSAAARKDAEQKLQTANATLVASEERFRQAFEFAGIGMALVGLDGTWLRVNHSICDIVGYTAEELRTKTFQDITHPDDLAADLAHVQELLDGRRRFYQMEKRYFHRDGRIVWIRLTASLVRDPAGAPQYFVAQIEDITQHRMLQQSLALAHDQALEASRLKSEFLANTSHEIRTPMNAIIGMASLMLDLPLGAEQREMGQVILTSAESLMTILNDILDLSKIEAGKLRVETAAFDLQEVIEQTLALLQPRANAKHLVLRTEFDPRLKRTLQGDAGRIRQVLSNLASNAIKFTDDGEVTVRVSLLREAEGRASFRLAVSDTGPGIPAELQSRLFQPFTQADGATTRKFGGTGLGLAISRQLVELMGGAIGFESAPGRGSTFWFDLELAFNPAGATPDGRAPARAPAIPSSRSKTAPAPAKAAGGLRLLVVEDNAANRRVAQMMLVNLGHQVDLAVNGEEAIRQLARQRYDAVMMDCQMPVLDGYETTRRIRAGTDGINPHVPVIALTAHALPGERRKCLEAGMNDYVSKPMRPEDLRAALQRCGLQSAEH